MECGERGAAVWYVCLVSIKSWGRATAEYYHGKEVHNDLEANTRYLNPSWNSKRSRGINIPFAYAALTIPRSGWNASKWSTECGC